MSLPEFPFRVAGIPCLIRVDSFFRQQADPGTWSSDLDASGYVEVDYTILDTRGRAAPWLERKRSDEDDEAIMAEIVEFFN